MIELATAVTAQGNNIRSQSTQPPAISASSWNRSVILLLVTATVYFQTWADLWPLWQNKNATYTHGILTAALFLWLIWRSRATLAGIPASAEPRVLPLVLVLSLAWLLVARANIRIAHTMLWPVLAFSVLWAGSGWRTARGLAFPLGFLYFAIPFWDYLEPGLQAIASNVVGFLIRIAGTQASVEGTYILLPSTTIYIALTCSGAHFLAMSLAMGALAGELRGDNFRTRMLIMALAGVLSVAFNSVRILLIVLAQLHPTLQHAFETIGHLTFGWWVFALDIAVFLLVLRLIPASSPVSTQATTASVAQLPGGGAAGLYAAIAVAVVLPALSWFSQHLHEYPVPPTGSFDTADATRPIAPDFRWQPNYSGAAWQHRVAYITSQGHVLELYRNEYHQQSAGRELIAPGSPLFDSLAFSTRVSNVTQLVREGAPSIEVNRVELTDQSGRRWSALYTYLVDDEAIPEARRAQALTAWRSLYSRPAAGVLALVTPCVPDCAAVADDLEALAVRAYIEYRTTRRLQ
jgi:exosortase